MQYISRRCTPSINAYDVIDLLGVIKEYNEKTDFMALKKLAEDYSYEHALDRRSE